MSKKDSPNKGFIKELEQGGKKFTKESTPFTWDKPQSGSPTQKLPPSDIEHRMNKQKSVKPSEHNFVTEHKKHKQKYTS